MKSASDRHLLSKSQFSISRGVGGKALGRRLGTRQTASGGHFLECIRDHIVMTADFECVRRGLRVTRALPRPTANEAGSRCTPLGIQRCQLALPRRSVPLLRPLGVACHHETCFFVLPWIPPQGFWKGPDENQVREYCSLCAVIFKRGGILLIGKGASRDPFLHCCLLLAVPGKTSYFPSSLSLLSKTWDPDKKAIDFWGTKLIASVPCGSHHGPPNRLPRKTAQFLIGWWRQVQLQDTDVQSGVLHRRGLGVALWVERLQNWNKAMLTTKKKATCSLVHIQNWCAFGEDVGRKVHRAYTTTSPWG